MANIDSIKDGFISKIDQMVDAGMTPDEIDESLWPARQNFQDVVNRFLKEKHLKSILYRLRLKGTHNSAENSSVYWSTQNHYYYFKIRAYHDRCVFEVHNHVEEIVCRSELSPGLTGNEIVQWVDRCLEDVVFYYEVDKKLQGLKSKITSE